MTRTIQVCLLGVMTLVPICMARTHGASQAEEPVLSVHLKPFEPFLGKTWKGEFTNSTPEKPMYDVSRWERALNGNAIRVLHSVNNGVYGGETIIVWDRKQEKLAFFYFTTAGFYTQGTMTWEDGKMVSHETVTGNEDGITEVRSTGEILPGGRMRSKSEYLKNDEWVPGHEILYREEPEAKVVFR